MKKIILLSMGAVALLLCGCTNTNELLFSQSNTKIATIFWNSDAAQVIQFGSVDDPYRKDLALKIKVDGKIIFDSLTSTPDDLVVQNKARNAERCDGVGGYPSSRILRSEKTWGKGAKEVDLLVPSKRDTKLSYDEARRQNVSIIVQNNKIQAISIVDLRYNPKKNMIKIKFKDSDWIDSQLTRKECIELFGNPVDESSYFAE